MFQSRDGFAAPLRSLLVAASAALFVLLGSSDPASAGKYASIVIDSETGDVLHAANPDARSYPASLTKVMTLYLLFDEMNAGRFSLDSRLPVSVHAAAQTPSKLALEPGERISVRDAILALVTKSANDVAVVVAEAIGGTESNFAQMMTRKARALGMSHTIYQNASGLPNTGQTSTVRDQAVLARALIHNHADYYRYFSARQFVYDGQTINSHNRLMLSYPGADGIKTGYIQASGFNLIASAKRDGRRIIGVVFGGTTGASRDRHMAQLLDKGFARLKRGETVEMASVRSDDLPDIDELVAAARSATPPAAKARHAAAKPVKGKQLAMRAPSRQDEGEDEDEAVGDADADWSIQVGAYGNYKQAHKAATDAARKLGGLVAKGSIDVDKAGTRKKPVYRARIDGFDEDEARAACKRLSKAGKSCKLIDPDA